MTERGDHPVTRRRLLLGGAALAAGAGTVAGVEASGTSGRSASADERAAAAGRRAVPTGPALSPVAVGAQPAGLPLRQFAWNDTLARDRHGNPLPPRHDRLVFFDVIGRPSAGHATRLEAALRALERRFPRGPHGLLFTVGWGSHYFDETLGAHASPIAPARAMSDFELPAIDDHDMVLHLAGDDPGRLLDIENALTHGESIEGIDESIDVSGALAWRDTRTGFAGAGLPAAHQDTGGIPGGRPVPETAPLFMGFQSGLRRNQATEDDVAIGSGAFADGTTMAVSYMRLRLQDWWDGLDEAQRVARMYAPQMTVRDAREITDDASGDPRLLGQAIRRYGVVGHSQTSARARRHGRPVILRRDFDTTDGGQAGLHFVCLQRDIADFVRTRTAMNASGAQLQNPAITDTDNNGINEFIFVLRRGNYLIPPRSARSFPSASGRTQT